MPLSFTVRFTAALALPAASLLLSGCGGGSSAVGNTSSAHIRSLDAAVNNNKADILINGGATYGDQTFFGGANNTVASPYEYIGSQNSASFSYLLPYQALPSSATPITNTGSISTDNYYTAVLIGSFTANYAATPADPRILQTILLPPRASANGSQATLRVLNAAPDLGFSTQTVNGTTSDTTGSLNISIATSPVTTISTVNYGTASGYVTLPPGTYPVTVTLIGTGSTVPTTTTSITVRANTVYTLVVAEPSASPAAYDLKLLSE